MKFIIFSFLGIFLIASQSHAQLAFVCRGTPLNTIGINCPKAAPAAALHALFKNNFPDISYQKSIYDNGEGYSGFGTNDHAFYIKTSKDNKILGFQQGLEKSDCHYAYKIETGKNGMRYCNADAPKKAGIACLKIHANDPIRNPKNQRVSCEAFLEAMMSCSKDSDSTVKCKKELYAYMNKKDNGKPIPNPANIPMPESERGIADAGDPNTEFHGEPDDPSKYKGSGAGGSK